MLEAELAALLQDLRQSRRPVAAYLNASDGASAQSSDSEACLTALANQKLFDGALTTRCQAIASILERRSAELAKQL